MKGWRDGILIDVVTKIGNSTVQHGMLNDRIYLMKLLKEDMPDLIKKLDELALEEDYSKIFAKVPGSVRSEFIKSRYVVEAHVPEFYNGHEDVYFMAFYFKDNRGIDSNSGINENVLQTARSRSSKKNNVNIGEGFDCRICEKSDVIQMAEVYRGIFETYPFPIHDPRYIAEMMDDNVVYFAIWEDERIVSLASCEMDQEGKNVEMTDFATIPEYRGRGLSTYILQHMENEMQKRKMVTAYTIARSSSYGMNIVFSKAGYLYGGTLVNNTNISGNFESMNVWYKHFDTG